MGDILLRYYQNIRRGCIFFANPTARVLIGTPSRLFIPGRITKCACCMYEDVVAMPCSSLLTSSLKTKLLIFAKLCLSCLFLQPDNSVHDVSFTAELSSLRWRRCSFVSQASGLLGFVHAASEDGVVACTREILVFSRYFIHSGTFLFRINYKKEIVLAKRSITESV